MILIKIVTEQVMSYLTTFYNNLHYLGKSTSNVSRPITLKHKKVWHQDCYLQQLINWVWTELTQDSWFVQCFIMDISQISKSCGPNIHTLWLTPFRDTMYTYYKPLSSCWPSNLVGIRIKLVFVWQRGMGQSIYQLTHVY